jgi:HK97 family phage portal protein
VLRKHYNDSDIYGASNAAIQTSLELLSTVNQGMANAIKSTANLRGILKSKKAMLTDEDVKKQKDKFVADYMNLENSSGIAMVDSTVDFMPIDMKPMIANYKSVEELRNNIYRYFGVNEKALTSGLVGDEWEAFYEAQIEPFLIALGLEMTNKMLTERQRGFGQRIIFESNRMQYMSTKDKLQLVQLVDRGILTPNEVRIAMNLAPIDGGDVPVRRLDTAPIDGGDVPVRRLDTAPVTTEEEGEDDDNE